MEKTSSATISTARGMLMCEEVTMPGTAQPRRAQARVLLRGRTTKAAAIYMYVRWPGSEIVPFALVSLRDGCSIRRFPFTVQPLPLKISSLFCIPLLHVQAMKIYDRAKIMRRGSWFARRRHRGPEGVALLDGFLKVCEGFWRFLKTHTHCNCLFPFSLLP